MQQSGLNAVQPGNLSLVIPPMLSVRQVLCGLSCGTGDGSSPASAGYLRFWGYGPIVKSKTYSAVSTCLPAALGARRH